MSSTSDNCLPGSSSSATTTTTLDTATAEAQQTDSEQTLRLHLKKVKSKKIKWTEDTIDNEGLGRKKSKCCCQYRKPRQNLDESSSESEDDCDDCFGHTPVDPGHKDSNTPVDTASK